MSSIDTSYYSQFNKRDFFGECTLCYSAAKAARVRNSGITLGEDNKLSFCEQKKRGWFSRGALAVGVLLGGVVTLGYGLGVGYLCSSSLRDGIKDALSSRRFSRTPRERLEDDASFYTLIFTPCTSNAAQKMLRTKLIEKAKSELGKLEEIVVNLGNSAAPNSDFEKRLVQLDLMLRLGFAAKSENYGNGAKRAQWERFQGLVTNRGNDGGMRPSHRYYENNVEGLLGRIKNAAVTYRSACGENAEFGDAFRECVSYHRVRRS